MSRQDLGIIFRIFSPKENVNRVRYLVATLEKVISINHFRPGDLTPVSYLLQAYCYAGDFAHATQIANAHFGLNIDGMDCDEFIRMVQARLPTVAEMPETLDQPTTAMMLGWFT